MPATTLQRAWKRAAVNCKLDVTAHLLQVCGAQLDVHACDSEVLRAVAFSQGVSWTAAAATPVCSLLLSLGGRNTPEPTLVREAGLEGQRQDALWEGTAMRVGRRHLLLGRVARRAARRK